MFSWIWCPGYDKIIHRQSSQVKSKRGFSYFGLYSWLMNSFAARWRQTKGKQREANLPSFEISVALSQTLRNPVLANYRSRNACTWIGCRGETVLFFFLSILSFSKLKIIAMFGAGQICFFFAFIIITFWIAVGTDHSSLKALNWSIIRSLLCRCQNNPH